MHKLSLARRFTRVNAWVGVAAALIIFGFLVLTGAAWGFPTGVAGYADAPGDPQPGVSQTCDTACHLPAGNRMGEIFLSVPSEVGEGEQVSFDLIYEGDEAVRWGFDLIALDDLTGEPVGELIAGEGSQTMSSPGRNWSYLTHTFGGTQNMVGDEPGWTVQWRAPAREVEAVTFYAAFNAANGAGAAGDNIFTTQVALSVPEPGATGAIVSSLLTLAMLGSRRRRAEAR